MKSLKQVTTSTKKTLGIIFFSLISVHGFSQSDFLKESWNKQVKPLENSYLNFVFSESSKQLHHSFYPWEETTYKTTGEAWGGKGTFSKVDTLKSNQDVFLSKTQLTEDEFLLQNFGNVELAQVSPEQFMDQTYLTARYLPSRILNYFLNQKIPLDQEDDQNAIYSTRINETQITLYLDKSTKLLSKVLTVQHDDLFGDVDTEYTYSNYTRLDDFYLAQDIEIKKINGKLVDQVHLSHPKFIAHRPEILQRPADYRLSEETLPLIAINATRFNDYIHLLELPHTDDRVMIVEFSDFLLIAEAPLSSENGQLIIQESKKLAPDKPIKYFVFGHYHPHYLGGVRPFVHQGAKIISTEDNSEYLSYIVQAKRTVKPDSLHLDPKPLSLELINEQLTISDGKVTMTIYNIGEKSKHTKDYLIYHFPDDRILFEDDLVWIPKNGEIQTARERQAGLYHAIQDLGIAVDTIIQSWPVLDYGVKTIIPFEDLKKSMESKK